MRSANPGYWENETSGRLRTAMEVYLYGGKITLQNLDTIREYFRQWLRHGDFLGDAIPRLTAQIEQIRNRGDIERWLAAAMEQGIDPL